MKQPDMREPDKLIYVAKEIISGGRLEIKCQPEFGSHGESEPLSEEEKLRVLDAKAKLNKKNSRLLCIRLIELNFTEKDFFTTLTYDDAHLPSTREEAGKCIKSFIRKVNYRLKKAGLPNALYIYTTEKPENGRWHHHIVLSAGLNADEVMRCWPFGAVNKIDHLKREQNGFEKIGNYISKEFNENGKKTWVASRGLKRPQERVFHDSVSRKEVYRTVDDKTELYKALKEKYGSMGYKIRSVNVTTNPVNHEVYIHAILHK